LGDAAREQAAFQFTWKRAAEGYKQAFEKAITEFHRSPKVSVIVTAYNLSEFLPGCVDSVTNQRLQDWELIIVNDASTDDTAEVAERLASHDHRIKVIHNERNVYLAEARNIGMRESTGAYLMPLDIDDRLGENALGLLSEALDTDPSLHIVYGRMENFYPDGKSSVSSWPPDEFNFFDQVILGRNQLPYASMYRRRVWENTGGYRRRMKSAEDAEFWCRASSFGYRPNKVTDAVTLIKIEREDSMGRVEDAPVWNSWFSWKHTPRLVPFGAVSTPPKRPVWPVYSYDPPQISVVIPVAPGHDIYLQDALDSLIAQTFVNWEVVVVNDGGSPFTKDGEIINPYLAGFPFVQVVEGTPGKSKGPAWARNRGIEAAQAELIALLDADDYYQPAYLEAALKAYFRAKGGFVYTDWYSIDAENTVKVEESQNWDVERMTHKALCSITTLFPKEAWQTIWDADPVRGGGFDEHIDGWEDWEFLIAMMEAGWCGTRIAIPLWTYRFKAGGRREEGYALKEKLLAYIVEQHPTLYKGRKEGLMGCRKCPKGGGGRSLTLRSPIAGESRADMSDMVMLEFVSTSVQKGRYRSKVRRGVTYLFDSGGNRRKYVLKGDAEWMLKYPDFRLVDESQDVVADQLGEPIFTDETVASRAAAEAPEPVIDSETPLSALGLKEGTTNALRAGGVETVEQLVDASSEAILALKGIGPARLEEINNATLRFLQSVL
jgi:glycosyltransferase involved in cell wall biosynthesis